MRLNAKRTWLAIGALSVASLGCGHTRTEKLAPAPCNNCNTVVASRSEPDPSVLVVETPQRNGTPAPNTGGGAVTPNWAPAPPKAMPSTITPSPIPAEMPKIVPSGSAPSEPPKTAPVPPMPAELPKIGSLPTTPEPTKVKPDLLPLASSTPIVAKPAPANPTPVSTDKMGHASDYSWMVGRLEHLKNKQTWRVRFASHEVEDVYGGTVTLVGVDDILESLADGDLVKIDGQLVDPATKTAAPQYRVSNVRKLN